MVLLTRPGTGVGTEGPCHLLSADRLYYEYTVSDPEIYVRPFTVEMTLNLKAAGEYIYEFACHEGNYSLPGILAGARRDDIESELANFPMPTR